MKLLSDILYKVRILEVYGSTNVAIEKLCFDSREVDKFSAFVAVPGTQVDGHDYIAKAIAQGALAVVCEKLPKNQPEGVTFVQVRSSSEALGMMAANFFDNPSEELKLVGITGTNGKTTTATLLYHLFRLLGHRTGLLSTVKNLIDAEEVPATHTTPDPIQLHRLLRNMVESGCTHAFMEVSSHAIHQNRVMGVHFAGGVFTNITHDHLDYHGTFNEYIKAKKGLFDGLPMSAFALVNNDDSHGTVMMQNTAAQKHTYGLRTAADYKAKVIENQFTGLHMNIAGQEVWTKLIGGFNAYNLLAVYAVAELLGEEQMNILTALSSLPSVDGRFQYLKTSEEITGIVDYAHTPDALKNVLSTIADIRTGNEQVICVVGCGGDRDKDKRPLMARIACENSDRIVITSDNPRTEDPEAIISDMKAGVPPEHYKKALSITDRKEAIKAACAMANPGDIILVAGKGHEKYQEVNGVRHPFDDLEILREILQMPH